MEEWVVCDMSLITILIYLGIVWRLQNVYAPKDDEDGKPLETRLNPSFYKEKHAFYVIYDLLKSKGTIK